MRPIAAGVCACLALGSTTYAMPSGKDVLVFWQKKKFSAEGPPPELSEETRRAIEDWSGWAREAEYSIYVDPGQRTLLFTSKTRSRAARDARVVEKTLSAFDELLPPVAELPARPATRAAAARDASVHLGEPAQEPREPVLLFDLDGERDYSAVLDVVGKRAPELAGWTAQARGGAGFVLRDLGMGAWLEEAAGQEEHSPENEMVNRLVQLLVHRRFGEQPTWLLHGVAWHFESELCGGIYCFPYRSGFVGETEHTGWDKALRKAFEDRRDEPLRLAECADWPRGTFDRERAMIAWGVVSWFAEHGPEALPLVLADMDRTWREKRRVDHSDGSWELIAGYVLPIEHQQALLERYAGREFLEEVTDYFRLGRRYRGPK